MRKFSVILDRNTKYVLKEVIKEMYEKGKFVKKKPILKDGKFVKDEKGENIEKSVIGEFLIVGGDDVCAVFPADLALEISAEFQKQFEEKMNKFTENENKNNEVKNSENITSSCGVVIAKGKTPMFQLFEQGLKLQKLAKGKRYNENQIRDEKAKRTGYIDFQVIGNEGKGISESTIKHLDFNVKIPMYGKTNSLNASVAAALMIYEIVRKGKDDTLYTVVNGVVKFERVGRDKKQASCYPIAN